MTERVLPHLLPLHNGPPQRRSHGHKTQSLLSAQATQLLTIRIHLLLLSFFLLTIRNKVKTTWTHKPFIIAPRVLCQLRCLELQKCNLQKECFTVSLTQLCNYSMVFKKAEEISSGNRTLLELLSKTQLYLFCCRVNVRNCMCLACKSKDIISKNKTLNTHIQITHLQVLMLSSYSTENIMKNNIP